jgi:hypothetical protein
MKALDTSIQNIAYEVGKSSTRFSDIKPTQTGSSFRPSANSSVYSDSAASTYRLRSTSRSRTKSPILPGSWTPNNRPVEHEITKRSQQVYCLQTQRCPSRVSSIAKCNQILTDGFSSLRKASKVPNRYRPKVSLPPLPALATGADICLPLQAQDLRLHRSLPGGQSHRLG